MASSQTEMKTRRLGGKPRDIKQHNRRLLLSLMRFGGPTTAAKIARKARMSKTTVSKLLSEFVEAGLILSVGKGSSTEEGGKKPELFLINPSYRYVIAVQLSETTFIECMLVDLSCAVLQAERVDTDPNISYAQALALVKMLIGKIQAAAGLDSEQIAAVGIACDGIVDSEKGILRKPAHHRWPCDLPVEADIAAAFDSPVRVSMDNVCRYAGYAELLFAENRKIGKLVVIWNDDLVGGCVLTDGRLVQGHGGLVGEYGHMVMEPGSDIRCSCGGYGCFEPLVSESRVLSEIKALSPEHPSSLLAAQALKGDIAINQVFAAAEADDALALKVLDQIARYYAVLIRNITSVSDPEKIILQGIYAEAGPGFYSAIKRHLRDFPLSGLMEELQIAASSYRGRTHRTTGAAYHVIGQYLQSDIIGG